MIIASLTSSSACHRASGGAPATAAPCEVALAAHSGGAKVDREVARLQQEIRSNAKPFQTAAMIEKLGWSFVQKARESFDPGFYKLAEQCALCLESKQGESQSADRPLSTPRSIRSAALLLRGHALHNLHLFGEAEKIARELVETRGLAIYELQAGEVKRARAACDAALRTRSEYAPGLLALGRVLLAENKVGEAVDALERAAHLHLLPEYQ